MNERFSNWRVQLPLAACFLLVAVLAFLVFRYFLLTFTVAVAVALTAYTGRDVRMESVHAGFHYHLTKPVDADKLVDILVGLVRLTRPRS